MVFRSHPFPSSWSGRAEHGFCLPDGATSLTPAERDAGMRKILHLNFGFFGSDLKPEAGKGPLVTVANEGVGGEP